MELTSDGLARAGGLGMDDAENANNSGTTAPKFAPGADRTSAHTDTQADGINRARTIIGNAGGGELNIQGKDGAIRAKDTIPKGNDPRNTKG